MSQIAKGKRSTPDGVGERITSRNSLIRSSAAGTQRLTAATMGSPGWVRGRTEPVEVLNA